MTVAALKTGRRETTDELSANSEKPDNTAPHGRAGPQPQVTAVASDTGGSGNAVRTDLGLAVSNFQAVPCGGNGSPFDEGARLIGTQELAPGSTANAPRRSHHLDP